jgi:hypothetical protein
MGLGRSGTKTELRDLALEEQPYLMSLGARHRALIALAPESQRLAAHEQFLFKNWSILHNLHVPWYIPESLGGVGLQPLYKIRHNGPDVEQARIEYLVTSHGHRCGPSRLDVTIASVFANRGYRSFSVGRIPSLQPIRARPVWQSALRSSWGRDRHVVMSESDESFMDLSTYFLTPSLVAKKLGSEGQTSMLRRNVRAWHTIKSQMDLRLDLGEDLILGVDGLLTKYFAGRNAPRPFRPSDS